MAPTLMWRLLGTWMRVHAKDKKSARGKLRSQFDGSHLRPWQSFFGHAAFSVSFLFLSFLEISVASVFFAKSVIRVLRGFCSVCFCPSDCWNRTIAAKNAMHVLKHLTTARQRHPGQGGELFFILTTFFWNRTPITSLV